MAISRCVMHVKHIPGFCDFLRSRGWVIEKPKGEYEALRARHPEQKKPILLHCRGNWHHVTFGYDQEIAWNLFHKWRRTQTKHYMGLWGEEVK